MTDLSNNEIYTVFEKLDVDRSGTIEFEEFYFLVCILIAVKVINFVHKLKKFFELGFK